MSAENEHSVKQKLYVALLAVALLLAGCAQRHTVAYVGRDNVQIGDGIDPHQEMIEFYHQWPKKRHCVFDDMNKYPWEAVWCQGVLYLRDTGQWMEVLGNAHRLIDGSAIIYEYDGENQHWRP